MRQKYAKIFRNPKGFQPDYKKTFFIMKISFYLCPRTSIQKACFDYPFSLIIKLIRKTRQMLVARRQLIYNLKCSN